MKLVAGCDHGSADYRLRQSPSEEAAMQISDILRHKPDSHVWTIAPDATVRELLAQLAEHHIGALVVSTGGGDTVSGIVSERDVVRALHTRGSDVLDGSVEAIMTSDVVHCAPADGVDRVAALMTERRIRHLPVLDDGIVIGVVSIGDVVSSRIRELQQDRDQLERYVTG
jgi:CBS domain-containing protein